MCKCVPADPQWQYFIWNMCKCVPADPKCKYFIWNMCKCVPADPKCQYSIWNMCKWFGGHGKLCSRLGRQCVLHKNIIIPAKHPNSIWTGAAGAQLWKASWPACGAHLLIKASSSPSCPANWQTCEQQCPRPRQNPRWAQCARMPS